MDSPSSARESVQRITFFGDQTVDTLPCIKALTNQSHRLPILRRYLREAADKLQRLISQIELGGYECYRNLETIVELAEIYSKQDGTYEPIGCALWTISQFADYLSLSETDPSILTLSDSAAQPTYVVGVCGGLLMGAAAATARDINELLDIGRKLVDVSFNLGVAQWKRAMDIEGKPGRWAVAIVNVPPKQIRNIITAFNEDMTIPKHRQLYISFLAKGWAAISGPPSLFPELWEYSPTLSSASKMDLPLGTPAHAAHLPSLNIEELIGPGSVLDLPVRQDRLVISTSTCKPFESQTFGSLLSSSLHDITGETLNIAGVNDYVASCLSRETPVQVSSIGPTSQIGSFKKALEDSGLNVDLVLSATESKTPNLLKNPDARDGSNMIAIVGQSVRLPGSDDVKSFWEGLKAGQTFESEIPPSRFDLQTHYDVTGAKKSSVTTRFGHFLDHPGLFDCRLFNVSPREAKQMDPIQRLLMMCSYEALQTAGYSPDSSLSTNRMRVATYFGQSGDDWRQGRASQDVDIYYIPGTIRSFAPGKLNYHYKWAGGNYSVDSACAASTTSVMMACNALLGRECDMALAGGGQLHLEPENYAGLSRAGFLSKTTGGCKTFREDADGYCRGEGIGVVVLKRLEDALADNDNILAVVRGADRNYSWDASSITHPSANAQASIIQRVLRNTGVEPADIGFVEMHGTGTTAGDSVEVKTVTTVFGSRPKDNPLYVGAVKANFGHGEAAAGITSLLKAVQMLGQKTIPRQPGFPGPKDPTFDHLDAMNIRIPDSSCPFPTPARPFSQDGKMRILINNFDASGGNNCVLLEEAPEKTVSQIQDPRQNYTVAISARTTKSLQKNMERLSDYLLKHPDIPVADVAYTSTARRIHEDLKKSYTVDSTESLVALLQADLKKGLTGIRPATPRSVVFAFTGQGSQYSGMAKQLFETCTPFRESVQSLHDLAVWQEFPSFLNLFTDDVTDGISASPVQTQLAIVVLEMSLANLWKSWGVEPDLVIGYSLGEYVALYVSGVLSAHDVLFLVGNRARLMGERCEIGSYSMLAVQASPEDLEEPLKAYPTSNVACRGAPRSTVVSGPSEDISRLHAELKEKSISGTILNVPYGFHCAQVDPILEDFHELLERVPFSKPRIPVASSLDGVIVIDDGIFSPSYMVRQTREPVDFVGALNAFETSHLVDKTSLWVEIGPKRILNSLVKATLAVDHDRLLHSVDEKGSNWRTIATAMTACWQGGVSIKWPNFHRQFTKHLRLVDLPTYAFDLKDYWIEPAAPIVQQRSAAEPLRPVAVPAVPGFPTTSLQRVREERIQGDNAAVTFESTLSHPDLMGLIYGHRVNGVELFPASGWWDMAYTAAKYIHHRIQPSGGAVPGLSILDCSITHPLMPSASEDQQKLVIIVAKKQTGSSVVEVSFKSQEKSVEQDHGGCKIRFESKADWEAEWSRSAHFIKAAKNNVVANATRPGGNGHKLPKPVVYTLFSNFVNYSGDFKGIQQVYLNADFQREAVADVVLPAGMYNFNLNPYWSDALIHACGFMLHSDPDLPSQDCFLFNGFEELRFLTDNLLPGVSYTSYVFMHDTNSQEVPARRTRNVTGDIYIFQGEKIVGTVKGVVFQRLTKRILTTILGKSQGHHNSNEGRQGNATTHTNPPAHATTQPSLAPPSTKPAVAFSSVPATVGEEMAEAVIAKILTKTGAKRASLSESTTFGQIGLDSLEWIELVSDFRSALDIEIPASFFFEYPKVLLLRQAIAELPLEGEKEGSGSSSPYSSYGMLTPSMGGVTPITPSRSTQNSDGPANYANIVLDIVLSQTGFDKDDVLPSTRFDDMGLDSLCTMEVVSLVREQTGLDLPASFFHRHPTVTDVRKNLGPNTEDTSEDSVKATASIAVSEQDTELVVVDHPGNSPVPELLPIIDEDLKNYHCDFFLMQGSSDSAKIPMFFLPDGTGYPAVLLKLPPVFKGDNPLFTCKSPLLHRAEGREVACTIEGLALSYAEAIRRTRPHGPYLLAGYSLGAAYAYEVAKILADAGEIVQGLLIVDFNMAASVGLEHRERKPVPTNLNVGVMEQVGWMNGIHNDEKNFHIPPAPPKIKFHALSVFKSLTRYFPKPMTPSQRPRNTYALWAGAGMEDLLGPSNAGFLPEFGIIDWQMGSRRENNGPAGWENFIGGPVRCATVPCDHLSIMMSTDWVGTTANIIKDLIEDALSNPGTP
ncbi:putative Polyketide synthase [Venustampulla echinocandica]|uniref:Putative Polyketide synthase n=1 Tax=Venustampulla echinocandica TaxID=2656787 RepID=A0A370TZH3_9HELO|nr:putative Polyketide synthase [Venustampulla echinocandica]RDL40910.1 putative Polyketide synthase [Venustampulla echinocandica]